MTQPKPLAWPSESICLRTATLDFQHIARSVYMRTCRSSFDYPGFCVLNVGLDLDSVAFRQLMVDLKIAMAVIHQAETGNTLHYDFVARFDRRTRHESRRR